ncbi:MAG TPA: FAD/NAD(P)-binding oxidoreductase, partial [Roseiarcus sp.]|nr:FAD/NAD(P)-binding oxidoreductase [Roseiarcus sp.]
MSRIVILGAGVGGAPMAFELRAKLGRKAKIFVVAESEWFQFVPSNPWVSVNWRKPEDVKVYLPPVFAKVGVGFHACGAKQVRPQQNEVLLNDGRVLAYDYLVIATGPKLAFDEVEGFGPKANRRSICQADDAATAARRWEEFCKDPGPMAVGAVRGASCFGPAYEFALTAVSDLRRRKIRDRVPITFVTSEPYIGHLGLGGDTKGMLESILRERDIKWVTNAKVDLVTSDGVAATEVNEDGSVKKAHKLPSKFKMFIPTFRGVDCLKGEDGKFIAGLTNPRGFVLIDRLQRNPMFKNVFAVGVCTATPPYEATPVPVGVPKTAYMIESMVTATAHNIADL